MSQESENQIEVNSDKNIRNDRTNFDLSDRLRF